MDAKTTPFALLLSMMLSGSYVTAQVSVAFLNYPLASQQCLYNSADSSGCPTEALTSQDINSCLCANDGNFVAMSAQCVAVNDPNDLQDVWNTMVYDCASTGTPIQYNEEEFLAAEGSSTPSASPASQSSTRISRAPSPTTMATSIRSSSRISIQQGNAGRTSSQQIPSQSTTTATSPSTPSTPVSNNNNDNSNGNNSNNVGKLSGGVIGLIGSVAAVCALVIGLLTWCGCFRGKRSCSLASFGQRI